MATRKSKAAAPVATEKKAVSTRKKAVEEAVVEEQIVAAAAPAMEVEEASIPAAEAPVAEEAKAPEAETAAPAEETKLDLGTPAQIAEPAAPAPAPKVAAAPAPAQPKSREYMELTKLLDMYAEQCKVRTMDRQKLQERMRVLFSIVRLVAPNSSSRSVKYSTRELVNLLYSRMVEGSGNIFSDSYIFRLTYTLPPSDAVRFEAFYTALLQLVNARLRGTKISFNMDVLREVLKNESVMTAIRDIRNRLENK